MRKKSRTKDSLNRLLVVLLLLFVITSSLLLFRSLQKDPSKSIINLKPIDTNNWTVYTGSKTGISLKLPPGAILHIIDGSAKSDAPESEVERIAGYSIVLDEKADQISYDYPASSDIPSDTLEFHLQLTEGGEFYSAPTPIKLEDYPEALKLNASTVFFPSVDSWGQTAFLAACSNGTCITTIPFKRDPWTALQVSVSTREGWRYGGAPIDYGSKNFQIMTEIIKSISFN